MLFVQVVCRHHTQHGVTQKLQPFIAAHARAAVLVGIRAMLQSVFQQGAVFEPIAQLFLQCEHKKLLSTAEKGNPTGLCGVSFFNR